MATTIRGTDILFNDSTTQGTAGFTGYRNRLINGNMYIKQRTPTIFASSGSYTADRWKLVTSNITGGAVNVGYFNDGTVSTTGTAHLILSTTTAKASLATGDVALLMQPIESNNIDDFAFGTSSAKTITLSFTGRITTVASAVVSVAIRNSGDTRSFVSQVTMNQTGQRFTITIPGDTVGTWTRSGPELGMTVSFTHCCGTQYRTATLNAWQNGNFVATTNQTNLLGTLNAAIVITDVQLETGAVATPYENRPWTTEFLLCQRYYQLARVRVVVTIANPNGYCSYHQNHGVEMRADPAMATLATYANGDVISWTNAVMSRSSLSVQIVGLGGGNTVDSDRLLSLDAEL